MNLFDQIFGWPQSLEEKAEQWRQASVEACRSQWQAYDLARTDAQRHYQEIASRQRAEMEKRRARQAKESDGNIIEGECERINETEKLGIMHEGEHEIIKNDG